MNEKIVISNRNNISKKKY